MIMKRISLSSKNKTVLVSGFETEKQMIYRLFSIKRANFWVHYGARMKKLVRYGAKLAFWVKT
jgi:hypothetical protein